MSSAITLRKIIDSIKDLVRQVNIEASPSGLSLQAMDSAHVSLVSLWLKEDGFETYRCDKSITIGVDLPDFSKVLKMATSEDQVTLKSDLQTDFLMISFLNKKTFKESEFRLNLFNLDSESLGIPDTEYPTTLQMNSSEFVKLTKELITLTDTVKVEIKDSKECVFSYSGKSGNGKIRIRNHIGDKEEDYAVITCEEEIVSQFGLSYLNSFSKASSLCSKVCLDFSMKFPLKIHYDIESNLGWVKFYLAPKLDE